MAFARSAHLDLSVLALSLAVLALGLWHVDRYPQTWFDEGSYLEVAENLANGDGYVSIAGDGTHDYAPVIGVGPTVLVPAAAAVAIGDNDLAAARVVPALFLVAATALFFVISRELFGRGAALLGTVLLCVLPSLDWIATGRQVLGEVPALFFLLAGGLCIHRLAGYRGALAGGALFGLVMVTKGQYLLVLPATIVAVAAIDYLVLRQRPMRWYAVVLGCALATYGTWMVALLTIMGEGNVVENYRLLRESSSGALLVFDLDRMAAAWRLLLGPSSLFLVMPAMLMGLFEIYLSSGRRRLILSELWMFQALWLAWFTTASIAWPRYAFPGLAINAFFGGLLLWRAAGWAADRWSRWSLPSPANSRMTTTLAVGMLLALLALVGARELSPIATSDQRDPQRFAAAFDDEVPSHSTVDGWEPEITFLSEQRLIYPPPGSLDRVVRATWLKSQTVEDLSAGLTGDYLVIGPFARWVGVYDGARSSTDYELVLRVGEYELLRRVDLAGGTIGRQGNE